MKSLKMRNALILVLSFVFALSMFIFAGTVKPVNAEEDTVTISHFKVVEGAQIRIGSGGEDAGIRFLVQMNEETANSIKNNGAVSMGFIITPKYYFNKAIAEGYTDYLTQMKKDNAETNAETDSDYAYVGVDGEGLLVKNEDNIYLYKDGYYYASGAINAIKESNVELQFTAIAYYNINGVYTYVLPEDTNFARTYKQTATKAFVGGRYEDGLNEISHLKEYVDALADGTETAPIEDSQDLYNLSDAANNGIAFENAKFQVADNLEVDYDFTALPDSFSGVIDGNGKTVTVYNNQKIGESIYQDGSKLETLTITNDAALMFQPTERVSAAISSKATFKDKDAIPTTSIRRNELKEDAVQVSFSVNGNEIYLKTGYDKSACEELLSNYNANKTEEDGKELAVMFSYMANGSNSYNNDLNSLLAKAGYAPTTTGATSIPNKQWKNYVVSMSDFISCFNDDGDKVLLIQNYSDFDMYIGNIEIIEFNFTTDVAPNGEYGVTPKEDELVVADTTTDDTYKTEHIKDISTVTNVIDIGYDKTAYKWEQVGHNVQITLTMNYNAENYAKLAAQDEFKAKYDAVQFTYLIDEGTQDPYSMSSNPRTDGGSTLFEASGCSTVSNKWARGVLSIADFIASMNGYTLYIFRPYIGQSSTLKFDFYLGNIEFVKWSDTDVVDNGEYGRIPNQIETRTLSDAASTTDYPTSCIEDGSAIEGLDNSVGYKGAAYKFEGVSKNIAIYVAMNYTADEYTKLLAQNKFNSVRFSYAVVGEGSVNNNDQGSFYSLMSTAGHHYYKDEGGADTRAITRNVWHTVTVPAEDFIKTMSGRRVTIMKSSGTATSYDVYLGKIEFITSNTHGFVPSEDNVAKVTFPSNKSWTKSYEANGALTVKTTADGGEYKGDAILVKDMTSATHVYITTPYTPAEYDAFIAEGKFTKVQFSYLLVTEASAYNATGSVSLVNAASGRNLTRNTWVTVTIDLTENFFTTQAADSATKIRLMYISGLSSAKPADLYIGDIWLLP